MQFIVGDPEGHDDLCAHYRKNECRCWLCPRELMSKFDPDKCVPLTMRDILNTNGDPVKLNGISQRYRVPNAFYCLPFADRLMGVAGTCRWETMHAIDLGLIGRISDRVVSRHFGGEKCRCR